MTHDIRVPRAADFVQPCKWLKVSGVPVDLTDITLECNVKSYPSRLEPNLQPTITVDSAAAGTFHISFTAAQTADLVRPVYVWEVLATEDGGSVSRIFSGVILMMETGGVILQPSLQTAVQDTLEPNP